MEAKLDLNGKSHTLRIIEGTEGEKAVDVSDLRARTGYITLDDGYGNTGSCASKITFIDGEAGILRYRGIPIEELAEKSTFVESAYLLIYGQLPTRPELKQFSDRLSAHQFLHEDMKHHFVGFPSSAHPMAILSAMINAASCFNPDLMQGGADGDFDEHAAQLISQVRTIAAALTDAGAVLIATGLARAAFRREFDGFSTVLAVGGIVSLGVAVPLQFAADGLLSRAVWLYNRKYAK